MPHLRKEMACVLKKRPEEKSSGLLKFRPLSLTKRAHLTAFRDDCPAAYAAVIPVPFYAFAISADLPSFGDNCPTTDASVFHSEAP